MNSMTKFPVKLLILALMLLACHASFAQNKLSEASCAKVKNEVLAQDLLNLIRSGADEGKGNGTCDLSRASIWVKGAMEEYDTETKRIELGQDDLVYVVGKVQELQDENGPTNVFKVNYQIQSKSGKKVSGDFSFSRVYEQSYIETVGCAVIQNEPSASFIDKECL